MGKGGSKLKPAPASIPTVSTPKPAMSVSSASQRALCRDAGCMRTRTISIEEESFVVSESIPSCAVKQPRTLGQLAVPGFPRLDVADLKQEIRVCSGFSRRIDQNGGADEFFGWQL